jgi:hypothetical protein
MKPDADFGMVNATANFNHRDCPSRPKTITVIKQSQ